MKIRSLTIPNLYHFKDFHLDLTYPAGHEKAGKPLDKVCIIGQSGTGKTTLLKLISYVSFLVNSFDVDNEKLVNVKVENEFDDIITKYRLGIKKENVLEKKLISVVSAKPGVNLSREELNLRWRDFQLNQKLLSISFPAELDYDLNVDASSGSFPSKKFKHIDFSFDKAADTWKLILSDIQKYQEEEIKLRQEISKVAEKSKDISLIQEAVAKLDDWRKKEFNPIEDIADKCLNPLLKHFGLKVRTDLDFTVKEDIGFVKITDLNGNEVPNGFLSTGTKQVMLSAIPLYLLNPDKCQILYDEPERSLYPDIQRIIVDYYVSLTKDSQFFFSTHSPIIASSFEPWEIVELKFDENWNVYRDKYYNGENHVDNYFVDPRYLDYDLILKKVFDLKDTSSDVRMEALVELAMLKNQLDQLKQDRKLQTEEAKEILSRYKALAQKLAWKTE